MERVVLICVGTPTALRGILVLEFPELQHKAGNEKHLPCGSSRFDRAFRYVWMIVEISLREHDTRRAAFEAN